MSGTASEVGGIVSATSSKNTVSDSRIVTPATNSTISFSRQSRIHCGRPRRSGHGVERATPEVAHSTSGIAL